MDASRAQKSYEELFLEVNPLQSASASKGKTKDIHLESIDVSFGSLRILSNATVTLAEGRSVLLQCLSDALLLNLGLTPSDDTDSLDGSSRVPKAARNIGR